MAQVTRDLVQAGWRVEAEGKLIRPAGEFKLAVTTGIDWFELGRPGRLRRPGGDPPRPARRRPARRDHDHASATARSACSPRTGSRSTACSSTWGPTENGHLRFGHAQAGLLDALLAAQPEIRVDAAFEKVRETPPQVRGGLRRSTPPPGFHGELRPYQREGLGWLDYLQKFGFGGILADDMGLGKTVQVLAFLQRRRAGGRRRARPWPSCRARSCSTGSQEATKFTPRLRVLDYTGPGRHALRDEFRDYDLIITTYGTLRTDIAELAPVRVRLRDPRRGAGDQERRQPGRQGRAPAPWPFTGWP